MNNFLLRTVTGVVFLLVMVFGLIWDRTIFGALFLFILYFALNEFYTISLQKRYYLQQKLGLLAGILAFLLVAAHCFFGLDARWIFLSLLPLLLIPMTSVFHGVPEGGLPQTGSFHLPEKVLGRLLERTGLCRCRLCGSAFPELVSFPSRALHCAWRYSQRLRGLRRSLRIAVETPFQREGFRQNNPGSRRYAGPLRQQPCCHTGSGVVPLPHRTYLSLCWTT